MKIQFRSILFALVIPVAACGGDREASVDNSVAVTDHVAQPRPEPKPVVAEKPFVIDNGPLQIASAEKPMPTKFDELMAEGTRLVAAGKYGDAKTMFDAAQKLDKKNANVQIELARMYIAMKEKGNAVAAANKAVKLAPSSSQAWNTKGRAELNAHKYEEAIEAFTKAIELNDSNVYAWNNLGYTELLLERYDDAAEHLREATSRPGATAYMFNNLGTALEHLDELDDARVAYETGGKLGSSAAAASRKRLEGVGTIVIDTAVAAKTEPASTVREYDLVNEGDLVEDEVPEPIADADVEDVDSDHEGIEVEPGVKAGDQATF